MTPLSTASAASWAAASMPAAMPLITEVPDRAKARAKARALSRPPEVGERLPTMATPACHSREGSPSTNKASGGLLILRSRGG